VTIDSRYWFWTKALWPVLVGAAAFGALLLSLLMWLTGEIDRSAIARQERLVALIVSQMQAQVAHDQESATVWDDAVNNVASANAEWVDANLGGWMHSYFGHDAAVVLNRGDAPQYVFVDGAATEPAAYDRFRSEVAPLVAKLRTKLVNPNPEDISERVLSPGVSDLGVVSGRPAIISTKPIVSDTGEIEQAPGSEAVHVAIRYLDGPFLADLQRDYLFDGLRFSWTGEQARQEARLALPTADGRTLGYFIWSPFRPGQAFLDKLLPSIGAAFTIAVLVLAVTVLRLRRRSLKLRLSEAANRHMALHDALTGLPNRVLFNDRLDAAIATTSPEGPFVAVLYLDLDRFKQVNDSLGHPAGDELIRLFARRVLELAGPQDTVARVGGDEFTILLQADQAPMERVETLCGDLIASLRKPFNIEGNQIFVGVSIGVAIAPLDATERVELTRKADVALYHAKTSGRSRFARFDVEMDALLRVRRNLERDLRSALSADGELQVQYQPLYSSADRSITGFEALARWNHPTRGWIAPASFIPVAEEAGLIEALGERVLRQACAAAARWNGLTLAVNVSAIELRNSAFAMKVADILMRTGFVPHRLELEVTESALSDHIGACEDNITALRAMGVRIALDDFGTGFSSLSRLQQLSVDRIKIDRSFVQGFGNAGSDEAIVQAIVDLARATGVKTTAEGVETAAQGEFLAKIGCDELQGYVLSRPLDQWQIDKMMALDEPAERGARAIVRN